MSTLMVHVYTVRNDLTSFMYTVHNNLSQEEYTIGYNLCQQFDNNLNQRGVHCW